ncbi:MucBP domain-containing protein [Lactococcus formosensis]|uniref:MucBP domain-containing protein n=1 Tax=Lactococcus formosensis TaxID=1281486 RepID=A0A9X4SN18_9LACT|nr:MucBP domain-containing protein [Lactococcus formosensis]MDG6142363.1 MucBP domain-containing protein [Lactococcus formosensis]MDG6159568.1 MucBP domain-containing protein [Lactococcus formosensis]MDG6165802.1 MucBP domain-containing protein [Lactococcus formosensis]MDG6193022.1 MucBP domain-containing protein [Lactococcus formosensis]
MKKLTSVLALGTVLLGFLSPAIEGIAETTHLSDTTNGIEIGQSSEDSTQVGNEIDNSPTRPMQDIDENQKKQSSNVVSEDNLVLTNPVHDNQNEKTKILNEKSWLAIELDDNQAFIDATVTAVNKPESDIQKSDLENIKKLVVTGASSIPEKISDYIALEDLYVSNGTVSSIPDGLYSLNKTLKNLGLRNNHFIVLPEKLFDDSFWIGKSNGLTLLLDNNQIVSDVPNNTGVAGMLDFNSRNNMLEYFNKTDYHNNPQGQLMYQGGTPTINVPVGYDFNANTPDTTNLSLYVTNAGYQPLFPGHEFVYYDDGSSSVIQNGVATHSGSGKIWVKSKFSTLTNPFARTQIKVNVEAPAVAGDVTVKYEDVNGVSISDDVVKSGNIGEAYTTEQKDIPGYTFKEVQGNILGKFTDQPQTVTYVYEQTKDQSTVIVHDSELTVGDAWKSEDNFDSATDYYGNTVPFSDITVDGSVDTSKVGTYKVTYSRILPAFFSAENQGEYSAVATITVKDAQPVKGGDVTAKYIDTDGNKISDDIVKTGSVGETYTTEQIAIDGYTFKEVQGKLTGQFTNQAQTVTYVYTKNEIPNVTGTVLVKYVDTDGNNISEDVVKSGTVGEGYSTEKKAIEGYTFKEVQGNTTGQFKNQPQTVTYVYSKNRANTVNPEPKPENKPDSKDKNNNQGITSSDQHSLPATGENERMTMMSIILGLILTALATVVSIFRFKKLNK